MATGSTDGKEVPKQAQPQHRSVPPSVADSMFPSGRLAKTNPEQKFAKIFVKNERGPEDSESSPLLVVRCVVKAMCHFFLSNTRCCRGLSPKATCVFGGL